MTTPTPIRTVLIANRGEIAVRIARTCRRMGVRSVAVFSEADREALHVRAADEAVCIGPAESRASYLNVKALLAAAARTGADAIHPGYGFLAENADFAEACGTAGLRFIGPTPEAIRTMGSKREARIRMAEAGVPIVPGFHGASQDTAALADEARTIGFPLLVKASAGGGGKGMRIVRDEAALTEAIDGARREAASAFGDDTLLLERYVERPRHVEIQILGDTHGAIVDLFERECSIQRRHQKIIEEAPSPALDDKLRAEMGAAAVRVGEAIGYTNAGTVEFILDQEGRFYFLEVNTRLQVEHPVTECITGLDLVEEQIRIAEGHPLSFDRDALRIDGHAIECRIYAEDPARGFLPATGTLRDWHLPEREGLRLDFGVERGSAVSVHYDPMLAKVITHGRDRAEATRRMEAALRDFALHGVTTNRSFLLDILRHDAWHSGDLHTHFISEHFGDTPAPTATGDAPRIAAAAATLATVSALEPPPGNPATRPGFRNNPRRPHTLTWTHGEDTLTVGWSAARDGRVLLQLAADEEPAPWRIAERTPDTLTFEDPDGHLRRIRLLIDGDDVFAHVGAHDIHLRRRPRFAVAEDEVEPGSCLAPMPGSVFSLRVAVGDTVAEGDVLIVLEAMKMEHQVRAPEAGTVAEVLVREGQQVEGDQVLIRLDTGDDE